MKKKIVIVHTDIFRNIYAIFLAKEINFLGVEWEITTWKELEDNLKEWNLGPEDCLLHYRTAGVNVNARARALQDKGYQIINSVDVMERTSDKFLSFDWAAKKNVDLPFTIKRTKSQLSEISHDDLPERFVLKPINSKAQGEFCFKSHRGDTEFMQKVDRIPTDEVVVQEFIDYKKIFRVIVVGGKVLDKAVFYDEPTPERWKVSVCLNPEAKHLKNPPKELLDYGLMLAEVFETEVGFIDIYETEKGYVLSEINTACSLMQHELKSGYNISADIAKYLVSKL